MNMPQQKNGLINQEFYTFINEEVLPLHHLHPGKFWDDFIQLIEDLAPVNRQLLLTRQTLQNQIDDWHLRHQGQPFEAAAYQSFLHEIGYIIEQGDDFCIETQNVDDEIATIAGPQLVVPAKNARFALNAANARWGSLYDALYGSDVIPKSNGLKPGNTHNPARAKHVIAYAKDFLDQAFPLTNGSHHDVTSYVVYFQHLMAFFPDGSNSGLKQPGQFVALSGHKSEPETIVLKNNGLHVEIQFDRNGFNGATDIANIDDILLEAAVSTIIDCEDSVAAVDSEDKIEVYRNWLGLMQGNLQARFEKDAKTCVRKMNKDKLFTAPDGEDYWLHGRSLLLVRNVGHLMESDFIQQSNGEFAPEGIVDAVVTSLIGALDLPKKQGIRNSRTGSIYIVKPKMHGPEEVMFSCQLFTRVEAMLGLAPNTIKIGIMDEERRTSVNLKECIRMAKQRLVFINTGFLDRTGDEIHTSMQAGAFLPKGSLKSEPWIKAYENRNVDIGLQCGLQGKAQIGKGMWAMPDEMQQMMEQKINHPLAGATTAWVPSPTAAVLHAMHYHQVNVTDVQNRLKQRNESPLSDLLTIPLLTKDAVLSTHEVEQELENNIQGLLGYVVRWIDAGVGCSKVPDINNIGLMEDRATLRISSQHIANWLHHGICTEQQVMQIMVCMAEVVDQQNSGVAGYQPMAEDLDNNLAFKAAKALIFEGLQQPSGYTEPLLHKYRCLAKQVKVN